VKFVGRKERQEIIMVGSQPYVENVIKGEHNEF